MTLTVVVDADGPATKLAATTVNRILAAVSAFYEYVIAVLAVICRVIASGDRTARVSQMMLARRGQASFLAPGTAAPSTASDIQAGRPDRPVPGMRKLLRRARPGDRCP